MHLSSSARLDTGDLTVKSDDLWINPRRSVYYSPSFVVMEGSSGTVAGDPALFKTRGEEFSSGWAWNGRAAYWPWNVAASSIEWREDGSALFRKADITSCDYYPDPDYHVHSSYARITASRRLLAFNDVIYLGKYPVFYSPLLYTTLPDPGREKPDLSRTQFHFGNQARNGYFMKSATPLHVGGVDESLLLDYYQRGGPAEGLVIGHNVKALRNSALFYNVQDPILGRERWVAFGNTSMRLTKALSFQGRLQDQSDANVGNDYLTNTPYYMPSQLFDSAGLTGHWKNLTTVASYSRVEQAQVPFNSINAVPRNYQKVSETESLRTQTAPMSLGPRSWVFLLRGQAQNQYSLGQNYLSKTAQGNLSATRTWRPTGSASFSSRLDYQGDFANVALEPGAVAPSSNVYTGQATAIDDLRWRSPLGALDLNHTITVNEAPDSLSPAEHSPDYGIQANQVLLEDMLQPTSVTMVKFQSSYNLQRTAGQRLGFRDRLAPITADAAYMGGFNAVFFAHEVYKLDGGNQSTIAGAQLGDLKESFLNVSAGYLNPGAYSAQTYNATVQAGWRPKGGPWQILLTLGGQAQSESSFWKMSGARLFNKALTIVKEWHDFHTSVSFVARSGNILSVSGNIQLRFRAPRTAKERNAYWESRWAPSSWAAAASSQAAHAAEAKAAPAPGAARPRERGRGLLAGLLCAVGIGKGCASGPPKDWKGPPVYLRPLVNKTQEPGLELSFNQPLLDQIMRDGRLSLAPKDKAPYQIAFTLTRYYLQPLQTSAGLAPSTYILKVSGDLVLYDAHGREIFKKDGLFALLVYNSGALSGGTTEAKAQAQIWDFLARRVIGAALGGLIATSR